MAESFIQWVIEDRFIAGRPAWERVGVEMVASVHAHEEAKIRILNATHSCVAWAGTLRGLSFIHEGMAVPAIRQMAWDYVTDDVIPCLDTPEQPSPIDLAAYRDVVLERFGNPYVRDTNQRVAMDGLLEDSRLRRADPARVHRARPADRQHGDAAGAVLRLPRALAPRRARLRLPGRRDGRRRARTPSSPRPIRWPPSAATRCSGPTSPAARHWSPRCARRMPRVQAFVQG